MKNVFAAALATGLLLGASTASARDSLVEQSFAQLLASPEAKAAGIDGSVRFYLAGQAHPKVLQTFGSDRSNKKTNAANKSDEVACAHAALSVLRALQDKAQSLGANAVVDMVSLTNSGEIKSASNYSCRAGNIIAGVAMKGSYAKVGK